MMKALFLAGGKGIRLQPLTNGIPKPMVPILNKPLLERTMLHLKKSGISEIVISSCYQPKKIKDYFGNGERFGLKIQYIVEDIPLGTGGAIKNAEGLFDDTFAVFNSDILCDIDMLKMMDYHRRSRSIATIAATEVEDPSAYGVIESDEQGNAVSFIEKPKAESITSHFINAGIYLFETEIFKEISLDGPVSVERVTFPKLLEKRLKIAVYKDNNYWIDIGTLEKYKQAHKDILDGKCKMVDCITTGSGINLGGNVKIHPDSKIIAPVYIGDNVEIAAKAIISNSVIGNNVSIGPASRIIGSVIWDDIHISNDVRLTNTIITSNCDIKKDLNYLNAVCSGKNKGEIERIGL